MQRNVVSLADYSHPQPDTREADCLWALKFAEDMADLRDVWKRVWGLYGGQVPRVVLTCKDQRKALFESAETDKMLLDLRNALFSLRGYSDTPGWVNGIGWGTIRKAKADGESFTISEQRRKQVKAIIAMADPGEDVIDD